MRYNFLKKLKIDNSIKLAIILPLIISVTGLYFTQNVFGQEESNFYPQNYKKEIEIYLDSFEDDLKNFPVMVKILEDHDLKKNAQPDGKDIFFVDSNGNRLSYEIETWDSKNGTLIAWVKVNLSENNRSFFILYGNPNVTSIEKDCTTWNENYILVLHLNDNFDDSSCNQFSGNNYETLQKTSKIGMGTEFDGQSSFVNFGNIHELDNLTELTVSAWVWNNDLDSDSAIVSKWGNSGNSFMFSMDKEIGSNEDLRTKFYSFLVYQDSLSKPHVSKRINSSNNSSEVNQWQHVVASFKQNFKGELELWINGNKDSGGNISPKTVTSIFPTTTDVLIGATQNDADKRFFSGVLDEIRITKVQLDENWIKAEYVNQNEPTKFYEIGPEIPPVTGSWFTVVIISIIIGISAIFVIFIIRSRQRKKGEKSEIKTNSESSKPEVFDKKALIIGVSQYDDKRLEQLEFCENDAKAITNLLSSLNYKVKNEHNLIGRVSGSILRDSIIDFFNDDNVLSTDTLILYFSGHGIPELDDTFFASSDVDKENPMKRGFSFSDLKNAMNRSIAKKIVVILDCCYSGSASLGKSSNDVATIGHKKIKNIMEKDYAEGKCLLLSSQDYQKSYLLENEGFSLYTYYLLEGLKGKKESVDVNGNVTVQTLSRYIYDRVTEVSKQKPLVDSKMSGDIVLASSEDLTTE